MFVSLFVVKLPNLMFVKCITPSVKYQLSVCEFNRLISPEQNTALTQTFYQKIHLRRLIPHTKLYVHTSFRHAQREGRSSMSSFQLLDRVLYYQIPITCYTPIIGSFKYNCSPSFHSVTEKSKQKFPVTHTYQRAFFQKFTDIG